MIRQLDKRKPGHVSHINQVGDNSKSCGQHGKPVDERNDKLQDDTEPDQPNKETLGDHGVFFDQLGEVIEARCLTSLKRAAVGQQFAICMRATRREDRRA